MSKPLLKHSVEEPSGGVTSVWPAFAAQINGVFPVASWALSSSSERAASAATSPAAAATLARPSGSGREAFTSARWTSPQLPECSVISADCHVPVSNPAGRGAPSERFRKTDCRVLA